MLSPEEIDEVENSDVDILTTREVTHLCGHVRVYEGMSACQKSFLERWCDCPDCEVA